MAMKVVQPPIGSSGVPLPQVSISSWVNCGRITGRGKNLCAGMLLVSVTDKSTIVRAMMDHPRCAALPNMEC